MAAQSWGSSGTIRESQFVLMRLNRKPWSFSVLSRQALAALQEWSFFWVWDPETIEVRWMTSFDTTPDDIDRFAAGVASLVDEHVRL